MKVFLSWSGERSRRVGELLDEWLQCVLQALNPWMSSKDIDRGTLWFNEINNQLKDTGMGIVCLTAENLNKPWILFEAGALSKGLTSNRVFTFLIDLKSEDVGDPLGQFNHTFPEKGSVKQLVMTLNRLLNENCLKESVLDRVFDTYWPQFKDNFDSIIKSTSDTKIEVKRTENDILLDILSATRNLDKRIRNIEASRYKYNMDDIENYKNDENIIRLNLNERKGELIRVAHDLFMQNYEEEYIIHRLCTDYGISRKSAYNILSSCQILKSKSENSNL